MSILPYCMMPDGGDPCKGYAALKAERDRLRAALRHLVNHWDEFGAEYGLDESFHLARRALEGAPAKHQCELRCHLSPHDGSK